MPLSYYFKRFFVTFSTSEYPGSRRSSNTSESDKHDTKSDKHDTNKHTNVEIKEEEFEEDCNILEENIDEALRTRSLGIAGKYNNVLFNFWDVKCDANCLKLNSH